MNTREIRTLCAYSRWANHRLVGAARRALDQLALVPIRDHLRMCVRDDILEKGSSGPVEELTTALDRFFA
jgi:DNA-binding FrmR family transcriptional regulator